MGISPTEAVPYLISKNVERCMLLDHRRPKEVHFRPGWATERGFLPSKEQNWRESDLGSATPTTVAVSWFLQDSVPCNLHQYRLETALDCTQASALEQNPVLHSIATSTGFRHHLPHRPVQCSSLAQIVSFARPSPPCGSTACWGCLPVPYNRACRLHRPISSSRDCNCYGILGSEFRTAV